MVACAVESLDRERLPAQIRAAIASWWMFGSGGKYPRSPAADVDVFAGVMPYLARYTIFGAMGTAFEGTARFQVLQRVGAGGMGIVYEAFDRERSTRVALKTLRQFDPAALVRFKQEFRSLADVTHPNLIALYELLSEGEQWFFTMEFVEGANFLEYLHHRPHLIVEPSTSSATSAETRTLTQTTTSSDDRSESLPADTPADFERLRSALPQLAAALHVVHSSGKLHRDIKPSNVMVTNEGRVVVLDFGLTFDMHQSGERPAEPAGTLAYMSPEQARGAKLTPASDWYSVGVMLYKALSGHLPRTGAEPPSQVVPSVPEDLDRLCMDLLAPEPAGRPGGPEILRRLSPAEAAPAAVIETSPEPVFVGRHAELDMLQEGFEKLRAAQCELVLVAGASGAGKSAMVRRFLEGLSLRDDTLVLAGRCYEQESVPYKAFDSLMDQMAACLHELDPLDLAHITPRNPQAVARIFPAFAEVATFQPPPGFRSEGQDPAEVRRRAFAGCRELLARLGDHKRLVLAIDDLQWSDADSAALLAEILRPPDAPAVMLIATYRSGAALPPAMAEAVATVASRREIAIHPLSPQESRELAERLLGDSPAARERAAAIARESGGHAYFIHELAHAAGEVSGDTQLDSVIWRRVSALPAASRSLLETIALSIRPITQQDAYAAAGFEELTPAILTPLKTGGLVRGTGPNRLDLIEPYHDRIRESIAGHLTSAELAEMHGSLARVLEASGRADADALATHFDRAGRRAEARRYYILAGERAAQTVAFDRAVSFYRRALELAEENDPGRDALKTPLASALANAGRGREAATLYEELAATASPETALDFRRRAAQQYCISGHLDEGGAALSQVLRQTGLWEPMGIPGTLALLLANRWLLRLRGLRLSQRDPSQVSSGLLARVDAARTASMALTMVNVIKGAYFNTKGLRLAVQTGDPVRVFQFLFWEAAIQANERFHARERADRLLDAARAILAQRPSPELQALLRLGEGTVEFLFANFPQSLKLVAEAESLMESTAGFSWELNTARVFLTFDLFNMGSYRELARRVPHLVQNAYERGDLYCAANIATYPMVGVHLAANRPGDARRAVERAEVDWSRGAYQQQHINFCLALGYVDLYEGKGRDAVQRFENDWPRVKKGLLHYSWTNSTYLVDLSARGSVSAAARSEGEERQRWLRAAEKAAASLAQMPHPLGLVFATAARAGIAAVRGDRSRAAELLERTAALYEQRGMQIAAASARRRLGLLIGGDRGAEYVRAGEATMRQEGVQDCERMTSMFLP